MAKKKVTNGSTYKKQELVDLMHGLMQVEDLKSVGLAVCAQENIRHINDMLKDIEDKAIPSSAFLALAGEMQQYNMETEIEKVKAKEAEPENAKLIEERKKQLDVVAELLQAEVDIKLFKIDKKDLPIEITSKQLGMINLIVK
jgi:peroxiredoxin family protein